MTKTDHVLIAVREADPLAAAELDAWTDGFPAGRLQAEACGEPAVPRAAARRLIQLVLATVLVSAGTAGVAIATGVLGRPAPRTVQAHLAELDRGMPADLRYHPNLDTARAVAEAPSGVLYLADLTDGGYCLEIASPTGRPRGATCVDAARRNDLALDVVAPLPTTDAAPLLVGGRANAEGIDVVRVVFPDGRRQRVRMALDRSWLFTVPDAEHATALTGGLVVEGIAASGDVLATVRVPALRDDDPSGTAHDATQPLVLETISDGADLTLVLGINGRVDRRLATRLVVRYPDGAAVTVPIAADGTFELRFPAARQGDFARAPGTLTAFSGEDPVATRPIGSVAYWRARNG